MLAGDCVHVERLIPGRVWNLECLEGATRRVLATAGGSLVYAQF